MDRVILAFQTSLPPARCAVFDRSTIFAETEWDPKKDRDLLSNVINTLKKADKNIDDIDGVFVVNGPGDFTPVRISVLLANNLANSLNIPVYSLLNTKINTENSLQKIFFSNKPEKKEFIKPFFGKEPRIG